MNLTKITPYFPNKNYGAEWQTKHEPAYLEKAPESDGFCYG